MKQRILVLSEVYPPSTGGSGRWLYEVYSRLKLERLIVVTTNAVERPTEYQLPSHVLEERVTWGFSDWGVTRVQSLGRYASLVLRAVLLCRKHKIEAIHCGRNLPEGIIGAVVSRLLGIPLLCFVHGEDVMTALSSGQLKWLTNSALRCCQKVVANSRNTARLLQEDWGLDSQKVTVLNPGVDSDYFSPAEDRDATKASLGWSGKRVVLTVGRLQRRKGHDHVIACLSGLRKQYPDLLYVIVGSGDQAGRLAELVKKHDVADIVEFRGETTDAELLSCYQACDLFVLANREINGDIEGFGMVLVEAQACARPVLAGTSGGTSETMEPGVTGELVDAADVTALRDRLGSMLNDLGQLDTMGQLGRQRVVEYLDWKALASAARRLLQE